MNVTGYLEMLLLVGLAVSVTAFLITGVVRLALGIADHAEEDSSADGRSRPQDRLSRSPSRR
jgi:hypothetical protein